MKKKSLLALAGALAILTPSYSYAQVFERGNKLVNHTPSVSTQATASVAAAANVAHVAARCSGSINTVAAQAGITLSLRDGASGAGTVLWSATAQCVIGTPCVLDSGALNVPGTVNTAMTCEWSGAPTTNNFAVANLAYYNVRS